MRLVRIDRCGQFRASLHRCLAYAQYQFRIGIPGHSARPRKAGLGRNVGIRIHLEHVETTARDFGGRLMVIETSSKESYEHTAGFYRRLGYAETARILDYYDAGDDKLIFIKRLSYH